MNDYKVYWEIDISANSHREAAERAWELMREPFSTANVFTVSDGKETVCIDLQEDVEN